MATVKAISAMAKRQKELRDHLWPGMEGWLWERKTQKGFATIPKTMPLILKIMDEMTKGVPVSSTYFALWCSTWDNNFVSLSRAGDLANAAGFGGQRAEHTWAARMKALHALEFVDIKPGKSGPLGHAIIWNPHFIIRWHHHAKDTGMTEASYNALLETAVELGITDMTVDWQQPHSPRTRQQAVVPGQKPPKPKSTKAKGAGGQDGKAAS